MQKQIEKVECKRDPSGSYRVAGPLSFDTVRNALKESTEVFAAEGDLNIDLSQVTNADSAGLALLIEWYRWAAERDRQLKFIGAPAQLRALAKISDLETVLPFA